MPKPKGKLKSHSKIKAGLYAYPSELGNFTIKKIIIKGYAYWKVITSNGPWLGEIEFKDEFNSLGEAKIFIDEFCNEQKGKA